MLIELIASRLLRPTLEFARAFRLRLLVVRREKLRAQKVLHERLGWREIRGRQKRQIMEVSESFSIFYYKGSERYDATQLLAELMKHVERGQMGFMIASESGSGKTVLASLLPLLCRQLPELRAAALFLDPGDWKKGSPIEKVRRWLSSCSSKTRKLIVFDSLDEGLDNASLFKDLLREVRTHSSNCGCVMLFRPPSSRYAEDIVSAVSSSPIELRMEFDYNNPQHCAVFCHRFSQFSPGQISFLLRVYAKTFPGYQPTRMSSGFVLQHLVRRFEKAHVQPSDQFLLRAPGDVLFEAIIGPQVDLKHPCIEPLSHVAFEILNDGRPASTVSIESLSGKLKQPGYPRLQLSGSLMEAKKHLVESESPITLSIQSDAFLISSEMDVHALAAVHVARLFETSNGDGSSNEFAQLCGTAKYDRCAQFVLPAHQRLSGSPGAIYRAMSGFLEHEDASFSFCAQLIHSNYDFSPLRLDEAEELNSKLFRKLIQVIDLDRRKTCDESIRDARTGPNPVLDQLFVVVAAYGDSVVRLLVDHILLTSQTDLEKSQGAYLILHWLRELFAHSEKADLPARRHHIYTILNGFELLQTANLHVRFHVMEVLDFLITRAEPHLIPMPGFSQRLNLLLERYGCGGTEQTGDSEMVRIYRRCNSLVSAWATAEIGSRPTENTLSEIGEERLPQILSAFEEQIARLEQGAEVLETGELELFLECYEVLLGIVRRTACQFVRPRYLEFLHQAAGSRFWIVRWWAFYNVSRLVLDLPRQPYYEHTISECVEWMSEQVYKTSEPVGLKHRQCALLEAVAEERPEARVSLRRWLDGRPPLDEQRIEVEYSKIVGERGTAARSLQDYFGYVRKLSKKYR